MKCVIENHARTDRYGRGVVMKVDVRSWCPPLAQGALDPVARGACGELLWTPVQGHKGLTTLEKVNNCTQYA